MSEHKSLLQHEVELLKSLQAVGIDLQGKKDIWRLIEDKFKEIVNQAEQNGFERGLHKASELIHFETVKRFGRNK